MIVETINYYYLFFKKKMLNVSNCYTRKKKKEKRINAVIAFNCLFHSTFDVKDRRIDDSYDTQRGKYVM